MVLATKQFFTLYWLKKNLSFFQFKASNAIIEEKLGKMTYLENQLVAVNDRLREMQSLLDMKAQSAKDMKTQLEVNSKK